MNKKHKISALFLVLAVMALLGPVSVFAAVPRVGIARVSSNEDAQIQAVAYNVERLIVAVLEAIGGYQLSRVSEFNPLSANPMESDELSDLDYVLFGLVETNPDDSIVIRVAVYSRAESRVTEISTKRLDSVFELFDASELAVVEVLEGFTGETIRFATLQLRNTGAQASYDVLLNGQALGQDLTSIQVLAGSGTLQIRQQGRLVHSQEYNVEADQLIRIDFELPEPLPVVLEPTPQEQEASETAEDEPLGPLEIVLSPAANIYGDMWMLGSRLGLRYVTKGGLAFGIAPSFFTNLGDEKLALKVIGLEARAGYLFGIGSRFRIGPQLAIGGIYRMVAVEDVFGYADNGFGAVGAADAAAELNLGKALWLGLQGGVHVYYRTRFDIGTHVGAQLAWRL